MEYQRRSEQIINPGPEVPDLLKLQHKHRSEQVWKEKGGNDHLKVQRAFPWKYEEINEKIKDKLRMTGFDTIMRIGGGKLDLQLVTALVERWRPETHTFHLPVGEVTITLQDVEIMTGLCVDGMPVTSNTESINWRQMCEELLGKMPGANDLIGIQLKHSWLDLHFSGTLPEDANDYVVECYTRATILRIFGGLMFNNKSGNKVSVMPLPLLRDLTNCRNYAWGAAVLAFLYRELCLATNPTAKQMGGYVKLLQCWAYERIPIISPTIRSNYKVEEGLPYALKWRFSRDDPNTPLHNLSVFRDTLDGQKYDEFIWEPYTEVLQYLQLQGDRVWRAEVPLIYFHIVENHQPDRCLRQFGMEQHIPHDPQILDSHHTISLRGKLEENWPNRHEPYIQLWTDRYNRVWSNIPLQNPLGPQSQYMQWYVKHTRRWMTPKGARVAAAADGLQRVYHMEPGEGSWTAVRNITQSLLGGFEEEERLASRYPAQPACPSQPMPRISEPDIERRRRRRNLSSRRRDISPVRSPEGINQVPTQMFFDMYSQHVEDVIPQNQPAAYVDEMPSSFMYNPSATHQSQQQQQQQQPEDYYPSMQFDIGSQMGERSLGSTFFTPNHTPAPVFRVHNSTTDGSINWGPNRNMNDSQPQWRQQRDIVGSSSNDEWSSLDNLVGNLFDGAPTNMISSMMSAQTTLDLNNSINVPQGPDAENVEIGTQEMGMWRNRHEGPNQEDGQMGDQHQPPNNRKEPSRRLKKKTTCLYGSHLR